jgi:hypothetical protein
MCREKIVYSMRKFVCVAVALSAIVHVVNAQDEGDVVIKDRFIRDNSVFLAAGPSFTLGENLGDYSTGISIEAGYLKKANKLLSWGPSLSYLAFAYDETKTYEYYYDVQNDNAIEAYFEGGNISLISLGVTLKLNLIPVGDNTPITVYGILNPFASFVMRSELSASGDFYKDLDLNQVYDDYSFSVTYIADDYPALASDNKVTGGAHVGFGIEFAPAKPVSFFLQATFSYTLPVSYVSTSSYLKDEDRYIDANGRYYYDATESFYQDEFPIIESGFSALSVKAGISINF